LVTKLLLLVANNYYWRQLSKGISQVGMNYIENNFLPWIGGFIPRQIAHWSEYRNWSSRCDCPRCTARSGCSRWTALLEPLYYNFTRTHHHSTISNSPTDEGGRWVTRGLHRVRVYLGFFLFYLLG
jgi:hypothetical protein